MSKKPRVTDRRCYLIMTPFYLLLVTPRGEGEKVTTADTTSFLHLFENNQKTAYFSVPKDYRWAFCTFLMVSQWMRPKILFCTVTKQDLTLWKRTCKQIFLTHEWIWDLVCVICNSYALRVHNGMLFPLTVGKLRQLLQYFTCNFISLALLYTP